MVSQIHHNSLRCHVHNDSGMATSTATAFSLVAGDHARARSKYTHLVSR